MVRLRAERLVAGGDALARLEDGRIAFVPGALPGEAVDVEITTERSDFVRARLVEVADPSVHRVEPPCPHRTAGCGGCGWMHLAPPEQSAAKVGIVAESLRRIGRFPDGDIERWVSFGGSVPPTGYRTSIRVHGTDSGVAFLGEGGAEAAPIDSCLVAHPTLSSLLGGVRVAAGVELSLRTSVATGAVTARWDRPKRRNRRARRERTPEPGPTGRAVEGLPRGVHIGDRAYLVERVAGADLRVSSRSFFQSGPAAAQLLVDAVADAAPELGTSTHAVDAYGGVGLFAATAMAGSAHVTLVESERSAVDDARENLASRGADVTIVRAEVGRWAPDPTDPSIDVVVADPARPGLGRPGVAALDATAAPTLVLVHCDPVSLGRDARLLVESGYRPERVTVLDLFPQTPHVETVTRFTR